MAADFTVFTKECLKLFNYPRINSMNDEEVAEIFHSSNRCFLLSWMLKLLNEAYGEVLASSEDNKELLAELVYSHGFCTKQEKDGFVLGQLPGQAQVAILYRMFKFIKTTKTEAKTTPSEPVLLDNIETLKNRNLNLFPMYGEIKKMTDTEKHLYITSINEEIKKLKQLENITREPHCGNPLSDKKTEIKEVVERIKSCFPEMRAALKTLNREKNQSIPEEIKISERSHEVLRKCSEHTAIMSKFVENIKVIKEFENQSHSPMIKSRPKLQELRGMVKILNDELLSLGS